MNLYAEWKLIIIQYGAKLQKTKLKRDQVDNV
jgi:hypothetical protein